jgi:hypothetical protein
MKQKLNRIIYGSFIIVALLSMIMQGYLVTVSLLGLAILFDPFDVKQSWKEKPFWQKAVFVVQGMVVVVIFIPLIINYWNNW